MSDTPKRFDDWVEVDCNECSHYWDNSCDGAKKPKTHCNSYLATRSIVLPERIKALEKAFKVFSTHCIVLSVALVIAFILIGVAL